jgi:hypothetical protein
MSNPNNCDTCRYKEINRSAGYCYMFAEKPTEICMQHSHREQGELSFLSSVLRNLAGRPKEHIGE